MVVDVPEVVLGGEGRLAVAGWLVIVVMVADVAVQSAASWPRPT